MNYPLELGDAALLFFAACSSLISASSSSTLSAFPANIIPSRVDQMPPLTAETAVVTLSLYFNSSYSHQSIIITTYVFSTILYFINYIIKMIRTFDFPLFRHYLAIIPNGKSVACY